MFGIPTSTIVFMAIVGAVFVWFAVHFIGEWQVHRVRKATPGSHEITARAAGDWEWPEGCPTPRFYSVSPPPSHTMLGRFRA